MTSTEGANERSSSKYIYWNWHGKQNKVRVRIQTQIHWNGATKTLNKFSWQFLRCILKLIHEIIYYITTHSFHLNTIFQFGLFIYMCVGFLFFPLCLSCCSVFFLLAGSVSCEPIFFTIFILNGVACNLRFYFSAKTIRRIARTKWPDCKRLFLQNWQEVANSFVLHRTRLRACWTHGDSMTMCIGMTLVRMHIGYRFVLCSHFFCVSGVNVAKKLSAFVFRLSKKDNQSTSVRLVLKLCIVFSIFLSLSLSLSIDSSVSHEKIKSKPKSVSVFDCLIAPLVFYLLHTSKFLSQFCTHACTHILMYVKRMNVPSLWSDLSQL